MDKRERFIEEAIEVLHVYNRQQGYAMISTETLKRIMQGYAKKYKSPRQPGSIPGKVARTHRDSGYKPTHIPPLYQCDECKRYAPQADMAVARPDKSGECKKCKPQKPNVLPFRRR